MSTKTCPTCGAPIRLDAKFCPNCGTRSVAPLDAALQDLSGATHGEQRLSTPPPSATPGSGPALVGGATPAVGSAYSTEPGPVPTTLKPGLLLQNRYKVLDVLGKGGFGAVYKAIDLSLQHTCAVKENLDTSPDAQRQFNREATVLANLTHSNLPRVTDYFSLPGQGQYLVMDFIDGEDLQHYVYRQGPVPPQQALDWVRQIIDALNYLHSRQPPVVHRDIKPANIRLTPDGRVVLVDFGLVKFYNPQMRTTMGARAVTPSYSPPEQYGMGQTDVRSDIYALGATLFTLLTGEEPPESVQRVAQDSLVPAHVINQNVPYGTSQAIARAMALSPSQRYQSVGEFMAGLQQVRTPPSLPPTISPPPPTVTVPQPTGGARSRPTWVLWLVVLGAIALACGVSFGLAWQSGLLASILPSGSTATKQNTGSGEVTATFMPTDTVFITMSPSETPHQVNETPTYTEIPGGGITPSPTDTPLTPSPTSTETPTITPSITYTPPQPSGAYNLAFASDRSGSMQIYLMETGNPSSYTSLPLPSGYNWAWWPSFCPGSIATEVQDVGGSTPQWIYLLDPTSGQNSRYTPQGNYSTLGVPRCSPDGHYLAFSGKIGEQYALLVEETASRAVANIFQTRIAGYVTWPASVDYFYFMSIESTKKPFIIQPVFNFYGLSGWNIGSQIAEGKYPAVSPDGRYLAYICQNASSLCVIEVSSGQTILERPLSATKIDNRTMPATAMWSGDGQWIYFSSVDGGDWDIFRIQPNGSGLENLTRDWPSNELTPALEW